MDPNIRRRLALIILDGWGVSSEREGNAIAAAHTPCYDELRSRFAFTSLSVPAVPSNRFATAEFRAELGHRTIGAGREVETEPTRIEKAIRSGEFLRNEVLLSAFRGSVQTGKPVHFVGLLGDGGVHSSQEILFALLRLAKMTGVRDAYVHGILDGRDVRPRTADIYVDALEIKMADIGLGKIASLCGRFYGMDSGLNWERTARAYTMMVHGEGERGFDAVTAIRASFLRGISDEFIAPIVIEKDIDVPVATIKDGDTVVFFNHNGESMRQLVRSLAVPDAATTKPRIRAVCLTDYEPEFGLTAAFGQPREADGLSAVFERNGIKSFRITETSRSQYVSHFFNGRIHGASHLESRIVVPANGPETLDSEPESKSFKVADNVLKALSESDSSVVVVNFSAADNVANTGNFEKTIESVQFVDTCLGGVVERIIELGATAMITSSHPGCSGMSASGSVGPGRVPFLVVDPANNTQRLESNGSLVDVASTILGLLGIEKPASMTGRDLRVSA
jgi:2,3-bisphosphoglycerate-independent phosphoglycerate mutase